MVTVNAADVEWDSEVSEERDMGPELQHTGTATVTDKNGNDYDITWSIWEYPAGSENHKETETDPGLTTVSDFNYSLVHSPEDVDDD